MSGWRKIKASDVGKTMLVTNNLHAKNAYGEMSHRWIMWIQKSDEPEKTGRYGGFDTAGRWIHNITHVAEIPKP